jgi:hypothetical protein
MLSKLPYEENSTKGLLSNLSSQDNSNTLDTAYHLKQIYVVSKSKNKAFKHKNQIKDFCQHQGLP